MAPQVPIKTTRVMDDLLYRLLQDCRGALTMFSNVAGAWVQLTPDGTLADYVRKLLEPHGYVLTDSQVYEALRRLAKRGHRRSERGPHGQYTHYVLLDEPAGQAGRSSTTE